jgi:uncharacterized phage-associated protein
MPNAEFETYNGAPGQIYDEYKLKQLALYISARSEDDSSFANVKLNKLLFFSDFMHYVETGRSITGTEYIKMRFGPCPKNFHMIQRDMCNDGVLAMQEKAHYGRTQNKPIALKEADISVFSAKEISVVESVISDLRTSNGSQLSNRSHSFLGWELTNEKESIPYGFALIDTEREPTKADIDYAKSLSNIPIAERRPA